MGEVAASTDATQEPVVSSTTGTEAAVTSSTETNVAKEREGMIPRERFDEVYNRMRDAETARAQSQELIAQLMSNAGGQQVASEDESDPATQILKKLQPALSQIQGQVSGLRDERDREAFWRENGFVSADLQRDVEDRVQAFRGQGMTNIKREDVLSYELGRRQIPSLKKQATASTTPAVNAVAKVEGGNTAPQPPQKDFKDLSLEEMRAALRGKKF